MSSLPVEYTEGKAEACERTVPVYVPTRRPVRRSLPNWLWALITALIAAVVAMGLIYFIQLPQF